MVRRGNRPPVGPFSTAFVLRGLSSGKLPADAEVCRVGDTSWRPVHDLDDADEDAPTGLVQAPWLDDRDESSFDEEATRVLMAPEIEEGGDEAATRVIDSPFAAAARAKPRPGPAAGYEPDESDDATRVLPALGTQQPNALRSSIPRPLPAAGARPGAVRSAPPAAAGAAVSRAPPPPPVRTAPPAPVRPAPPAPAASAATASAPRSKPPALPIPPEQKKPPSVTSNPVPLRVPPTDAIAAARAAAVIPPMGSPESLLDADDDEVAGIREVPKEVRDSLPPAAGKPTSSRPRSSEPRARNLSIYPSSIIVQPTTEPTDRRPALSRVAPPPDPWLRALLALILVLAVALAAALLMLSSR